MSSSALRAGDTISGRPRPPTSQAGGLSHVDLSAASCMARRLPAHTSIVRPVAEGPETTISASGRFMRVRSWVGWNGSTR